MKDTTTKDIVIGLSIFATILTAVAYALYKSKNKISEIGSKVIDYVFNAEQEAVLSQLHPKEQSTFRAFIADIENKLGYRVILTSGYRTFQKQEELKKQNSSNASAGTSMHNYGLAIDLNAIKGTKILNKSSKSQDWAASGILDIAKKHNLYWGGSFAGYYDPIHFDLRNKYDVNKLLANAKIQFGSIDKIQGNQVNLA